MKFSLVCKSNLNEKLRGKSEKWPYRNRGICRDGLSDGSDIVRRARTAHTPGLTREPPGRSTEHRGTVRIGLRVGNFVLWMKMWLQFLY